MSCAAALSLLLLIDTSGSFKDEDWKAMRDGHANALVSEQVRGAITGMPGGVQLSVMFFSADTQVALPWTHIQTETQLRRFAYQLAGLSQYAAGATFLDTAMQDALAHLEAAPCEAERQVIDVATDAHSIPVGQLPSLVQEAGAQLVTINALGYVTGAPPQQMQEWLLENVVTPDGFVIVVDAARDFTRALRRKFVLEITAR